MRKIAVGDLGEFWYGDYKEPFEQLEGGVPGHPVGVVLKADDGKLLCAWCGKTFQNLASHVKWTHKTSAREYKETVGLLHKSALVSDAMRLSRSRVAQRVGIGTRPKDMFGWRGQKRSTGTESGQRKPEMLNKRGTCYAQALAVGRTVMTETGRLSERRLRKHGIFPPTIRRYFGDMDGFRRAVGGQPVGFVRHTEAELVQVLRRLAENLGRTPTASDLRRYGLPVRKTYVTRFGSWDEACRRAGLVLNVPLSRRDDFEAVVLETYATLGTITKTARHLHVDRKSVEAVFTRYGAPFADRLGKGGLDTTARRQWAAMIARRLAGMPDEVAA